MRENDGVAARILVDFGADAETIRNEIIRMLSGGSGPSAHRAPALPPVALTSPPVSQDVINELERLAGEKTKLMGGKEFEEAARVAGRERALREAAEQLVRVWHRLAAGDT